MNNLMLVTSPLRAIVLGAPGPMTALALHAWIDDGHGVAGFLCCEPSSWWRQDKLLARLRPRLSTTAALARVRCAPREATPGARDAAILDVIKREDPDLLLSLGYRRRVSPEVLAQLPGRALNIHPALLPAYAGPTPSLAMLLDDAFAAAGGATLHLMDEGLDSGPVVARRALPLPPPADVLAYRVAAGLAAATLIRDAVPAYLAGRLTPEPQQEPGPLLRYGEAELTVGPGWSRDRISRLAQTAPWSHTLLLGGKGRAIPVTGRPRFLPLGAPPAPAGFAQAPCADGIVRFRIRRGRHKRFWSLRQTLRLLAMSLAVSSEAVEL